MKISAVVSRGPDTPSTLEELELDEPRADEVRVRLVASGVCHTDLAAKGVIPAEAGPVVLGHEGAGVVELVGADVTDVEVGDHVVLSFSSCGACASCEAGIPTYCAQFAALNGPGLRDDGAPQITLGDAPVLGSFFGQSSFSTHVLTSRRNIVVVDPSLDLVTLAPFGCGLQTGAGAVLNVLRPGPDAVVLVQGAGAVGLAAVMAAASLDVAAVIASDPVASRRDAALKVGATHVVDPTEADVVEQVRAVAPAGATHALDTTGIGPVIAAGVLALAPRGAMVVVGLGQPELTVDVMDVLNGGKTIRGCIEGDADPQVFVPQLIELHRAGRFPVEELIGTYPLAEHAAASADAASGVTIKPVLVMDEARA